MGMNIYTAGKNRKHVGKRYAAGIWCWDCRFCLIVKDHLTGSQKVLPNCPKCLKVTPITPEYNPAMRELGLDKPAPRKHSGIDGASGFTWCIDPHEGLGTSIVAIQEQLAKRHHLITEYGDRITIAEFEAMFDDIIIERKLDGQFS